jgi:hypothetical protein
MATTWTPEDELISQLQRAICDANRTHELTPEEARNGYRTLAHARRYLRGDSSMVGRR